MKVFYLKFLAFLLLNTLKTSFGVGVEMVKGDVC